jgi:hypothetical protein
MVISDTNQELFVWRQVTLGHNISYLPFVFRVLKRNINFKSFKNSFRISNVTVSFCFLSWTCRMCHVQNKTKLDATFLILAVDEKSNHSKIELCTLITFILDINHLLILNANQRVNGKTPRISAFCLHFTQPSRIIRSVFLFFRRAC